MFGLGMGEILIIFVVALLFIGPKKLPELARSLGKGIREFQKAKDDLMTHINHDENQTSTPTGVQNQSKEEVVLSTDSAEQKSESIANDAQKETQSENGKV